VAAACISSTAVGEGGGSGQSCASKLDQGEIKKRGWSSRGEIERSRRGKIQRRGEIEKRRWSNRGEIERSRRGKI
jgi:hypothetical protein